MEETSIEFVREELRRRGFSEANTRAKAIPAVIDIVANTDRNWQDYEDAALELENQRNSLERERREISINFTHKQRYISKEAEKLLEERKQVCRQREELMQAEAAFNAELEAVETPTARDRVRLAKLFMANASPDEKSNTAYIYGLGAILGGVSWSDHFQDREDT